MDKYKDINELLTDLKVVFAERESKDHMAQDLVKIENAFVALGHIQAIVDTYSAFNNPQEPNYCGACGAELPIGEHSCGGACSEE